MAGDPLYDLAGACIYYRQYDTDRLTTWRRLLDQATARTHPDRRHLLRAYAEIIAILTCDLYPESGKPDPRHGALSVVRHRPARPGLEQLIAFPPHLDPAAGTWLLPERCAQAVT